MELVKIRTLIVLCESLPRNYKKWFAFETFPLDFEYYANIRPGDNKGRYDVIDVISCHVKNNYSSKHRYSTKTFSRPLECTINESTLGTWTKFPIIIIYENSKTHYYV